MEIYQRIKFISEASTKKKFTIKELFNKKVLVCEQMKLVIDHRSYKNYYSFNEQDVIDTKKLRSINKKIEKFSTKNKYRLLIINHDFDLSNMPVEIPRMISKSTIKLVQKLTPKEYKMIMNAHYKHEAMCGIILAEIYGEMFLKTRPTWLINPLTEKCMELDFYNHKYNTALEYNGKQHYVYTPKFHSNRKKFIDQVNRDVIKKKLCVSKNIRLIIVPYTVPFNGLRRYIYERT